MNSKRAKMPIQKSLRGNTMASSQEALHILLVEDDEVDIQNVQREFKKLKMPINLLIAKNGIEALDKLHGTNGETKLFPRPHFIILDINMPKMNGIEFLQKLRVDDEYKHTKVFILTTAYTTHDKIATQDLHVAGYVVKPLQYSDVMALYWTTMGGEP